MIYEESASIYNMLPKKDKGDVSEAVMGEIETPVRRTAPERLIYSIAFLFLIE